MSNLKCVIVVKEFYLWKLFTRVLENLEEDLNVKSVVKTIYGVLKNTEEYVASEYPTLEKVLPEEISFITTQELEDMYPDMTSKERENAILSKKLATIMTDIPINCLLDDLELHMNKDGYYATLKWLEIKNL